MKKFLVSLLPYFMAGLALVSMPAAPAATPAAPAAAAVPDIIGKGFDAYKVGNSNALDVWFKGTPMEKDLESRTKVASQLTNVESVYGKFIGWELVKVVPITASTEIVYAVAKFEKSPLWFAFDCYKATDQWTVPTIRINQNAAGFLPTSVLDGQ